jgi:hypothetical protein
LQDFQDRRVFDLETLKRETLKLVFTGLIFEPDQPVLALDLKLDRFRKPGLSHMAEGETNALEGFPKTKTSRS